jgi:hypothetical protein
MKENSFYKKELVQKAACKGCIEARKEVEDKFGNLIVFPEICQNGSKIAFEPGVPENHCGHYHKF